MGCKISVIIPIYNGEQYIKNLIVSLLSQNVYELIVIDDGSTDKSYDICRFFAENNKNVKVIRIENSGSGPARNIGIQNSTGDYLYFPDADDKLGVKAFDRIRCVLEKNNPDLLVFGYKTIYPDGSVEKKIYNNFSIDGKEARRNYYEFSCMESKYGIQGAPWNKVFKKSIIIDNNIEYPHLRRHQDEVFISNYVECIEGQILFISDLLYTYYANDPNLEWKKFPIDYEVSVKGLIDNRKNTILKWNENDSKTHLMISQQLFCKSVKACENLYSPKQKNMNPKNICNKISIFIDDLYLDECPKTVKNQLGMYHRIVFRFVKHKNILALYFLFGLKRYIDQNNFIRKILRKRFQSTC